MSDATDQSKDEAWAKSRGCPYCAGSGQAVVFDRRYDGRRVMEREVTHRGEVVTRPMPMVVAAHCVCPMGEWMRSKIRDIDVLARIPNLIDVLAGRSRWLAEDPTGDQPGHEYRTADARRMRRELGEKMAAKGGR